MSNEYSQYSTAPFHQTIVEAIERCPSPSTGEIFRLFRLIRATEITEGHDEIVTAIDNFFDFPGAGKYAQEIRWVKECLETQKLKFAAVPRTMNLDEFQVEIEKMLSLLKDRQTGMISWYGFFLDRLKSLHSMISRVV
ncbi:MAG TPA: hypothetical protein VLH94_01365 [Spirochaetia bacterium]|nr:hypothetical protein [Spirochaetia bacterium]